MHAEDTSDASSRSNISILTRDLNEIGTSMQIEADQSRRYTQYENYRYGLVHESMSNTCLQ